MRINDILFPRKNQSAADTRNLTPMRGQKHHHIIDTNQMTSTISMQKSLLEIRMDRMIYRFQFHLDKPSWNVYGIV